ncbi:hypothetical protein PPRY_a1298 [Pseudoalteromonas prydzensis ACAM 620]|nr:hypothetical protein [Pseudoalteromonas prydzensis ACAM 620]
MIIFLFGDLPKLCRIYCRQLNFSALGQSRQTIKINLIGE